MLQIIALIPHKVEVPNNTKSRKGIKVYDIMVYNSYFPYNSYFIFLNKANVASNEYSDKNNSLEDLLNEGVFSYKEEIVLMNSSLV